MALVPEKGTHDGAAGEAVREAVARARAAQSSWAALSYAQRAARLKKAGRYLASHIDEITETIHRENGKLRMDALAAELLPAVLAFSYYSKRGRKFLAPRKLRGGSLLMFNKQSILVKKPWGVVGIISPWNYPFAIPFSEAVMALLAGNAVILKTASVTPGAGRAIAGIFGAADLPEGLFTHVEIPGAKAGPAFISGGVDKLFFTGSTATGKEIMALAASRLLPLVLELGGADAAIIRGDADLDRAALGVLWSGFSNAGQSCGGAQRILVHRDVYRPFLEKLCALVRNFRAGEGEDSDFGPMTTVKQKEAVEKQIAACLAMGAKIAAQSAAPGPGVSFPAERFIPATVLTDLGPETPLMTDEIFGPVVGVCPVQDDDEALRIANSSSYGLTGSVWSKDRRRAREIAARMNAGAVMVNDHLMSHGLAETPWGGFGDSGLGKTHGEAGFAEMLKTTVVVDDALPGTRRNLWWHPYSEEVFRGIRAAAVFAAASPLSKKLRAVPTLLKIFFRYWKKE
ncbi:MAG: aldehyde dehydrogenase family protein [Treponema sp.]|jgi:succinate-semialdehyde dehydrogenase/glutarate-semialdehyde dehydrogenase|nr:aldehyde dehydrogenase family protein [Treponema sp.]